MINDVDEVNHKTDINPEAFQLNEDTNVIQEEDIIQCKLLTIRQYKFFKMLVLV